MFVFGVASALPLFIFFPFINAAARNDIGIGFRSGELLAGLNNGIITPHADRSSELGMLVWVLVYAQVVLSVGICLSYGKHVEPRFDIWVLAECATPPPPPPIP